MARIDRINEVVTNPKWYVERIHGNAMNTATNKDRKKTVRRVLFIGLYPIGRLVSRQG